ncbi:hypothetical protein KIN20_037073 [Parelaphostrongylus tenuis]|uniref:Uncharacterized protein n=1 Tax=Parelaphostrongylus tenuis TaxID=148309 RepID=A0AAD5WLS9_PARTN|nr:hypothetical protein KIN20_037073 [Parelaphostrongylus tenuis]
MRRDTVARRRRLRYSESCEPDFRSQSMHYGKVQETITSQWQNNLLSSNAANIQNKIVQPFNLSVPQPTAAQNFFAPPNTAFMHSMPTVTSSSIHYNTQTPMMMSSTVEGTVFSAIDLERQSSSSEVNDQLDFPWQSRTTISECDVFDGQMLVGPPDATSNVMKHDSEEKIISLSGYDTKGHQNEHCQSAIENLVDEELFGTDIFRDHQLEFETDIFHDYQLELW